MDYELLLQDKYDKLLEELKSIRAASLNMTHFEVTQMYFWSHEPSYGLWLPCRNREI